MQLLVSTLSFWGSRVDHRLPLQTLQPVLASLTPQDMDVLLARAFVQVPFRSGFEQSALSARQPLLLSLKHGTVLHPNVFQSLLGR
jgi:hypothetical protein